MEKKIERVPYISKWYKEEQKDKLLHFAFDEQGMTEETAKELNNCFKNTHVYFDKGVWDSSTITTTVNPKINDNSDYHYHKPISPTLKFEQYLTQQDVDYLRELLHYTRLDVKAIKNVPSREKSALDRLNIINNYISNSLGVRDKAHKKQLEELIEKSRLKKSYEGTLSKHKEELQKLYQIKEQCGFKFIKDFANGKITYSTTLSSIKEILGIDFIKDFIKACEKCED